MRVLYVGVNTRRDAVDDAELGRDVGFVEARRLVVRVIGQVHGVDIRVELVAVGAQCGDDFPVIADRHRVFDECGGLGCVTDREVS